MGSVSRRKVLGTSVAGLGAIAATSLVPIRFEAAAAPAPSTAATKTRQWAFVIDMRRCDGCKKCTEACQTAHHLPKETEWIKVQELHNKRGQPYYMPRICNQCENAPCVRVCPVGASFHDAEGLVLVDQDRCIGCRMCMAACPYGARYFVDTDPHPEVAHQRPTPQRPIPQQKGTVGKCMLCVHNTAEGRLPVCVEECGMYALYVGDLVSDVATNGKETVRLSKFLDENDAFRWKEDLNTGPRVYYIAGHGQDLGW